MKTIIAPIFSKLSIILLLSLTASLYSQDKTSYELSYSLKFSYPFPGESVFSKYYGFSLGQSLCLRRTFFSGDDKTRRNYVLSISYDRSLFQLNSNILAKDMDVAENTVVIKSGDISFSAIKANCKAFAPIFKMTFFSIGGGVGLYSIKVDDIEAGVQGILTSIPLNSTKSSKKLAFGCELSLGLEHNVSKYLFLLVNSGIELTSYELRPDERMSFWEIEVGVGISINGNR